MSTSPSEIAQLCNFVSELSTAQGILLDDERYLHGDVDYYLQAGTPLRVGSYAYFIPCDGDVMFVTQQYNDEWRGYLLDYPTAADIISVASFTMTSAVMYALSLHDRTAVKIYRFDCGVRRGKRGKKCLYVKWGNSSDSNSDCCE